MNVVPFTAKNAAEAVKQIRSELGPEAVVVKVRQLPANGLARLWRRPRIEVLACVPERNETAHASASAENGAASALLDVCDSSEALSIPSANEETAELESKPPSPHRFVTFHERGTEWRSTVLLERMGISSLNAEHVIQRLKRDYGDRAPESLRSELALTRAVLTNLWRSNKANVSGFHVFVGAPGSGKSTVISKWLTQTVLVEGESARVWRLDVPRANTAEALSVHCEALNVPVERSWNPSTVWSEDHLFIDLPGLDTSDANGFAEVEKLLGTIPAATVSLVLNAAYDTSLLQAQVRAFARLPLTDLVFTHLDEELRWSKLWDFVLGTNYSLSFLSAGQNIPGQFLRASPEALFPEEMRAS